MPLQQDVARIARPRITAGNVRPITGRILWARKVYHVLSGLACISAALLLPPVWLPGVALGCLAVCVVTEAWRLRDYRLHRQLTQAGIVRRHERFHPSGNLWTCLGMVLVTAISRDPLVVAGCLVGWSFGDPAAEIAGRLIPSKRIHGRKTLAGAIACWIVSYLAYLLFFHRFGRADALVLALVGATATTLAETLSGRINDNLTIPLLSALALAAWT